MRVGIGFDVHRLEGGRPLILGGVDIPYPKGLAGHSDADVLTHAIMDALLGALGEGDIGRLFPDSDPVYKGADSLGLLEEVMKLVQKQGYRVVNLDTVIVAQAPKIAPFTAEMGKKLAWVLGVSVGQVNIKATTTEKLGYTGRGEGIAAHAVVLLAAGERG